MSNDFLNLAWENGDVLRYQSSLNQANAKWKLINMLPTKLELWTKKEFSDKVNFLSKIKPHQTLHFHPSKISGGEELFVYYRHKDKNGKENLIPFMEPFTMRNWSKDIRIGAVVYSSTDGHGIVQASNWDMRGIWIRNKMPIPLDIYYKGNLMAQVFGYNGTNYIGGGASTIYFDNDRRGINFMDEIVFKYSLPGKEGKFLFSVVVDDEQCNEMLVGVVSAGFRGPNPDNSIYRIDEPDYTGITYYVPNGDYTSVATNPFAPF